MYVHVPTTMRVAIGNKTKILLVWKCVVAKIGSKLSFSNFTRKPYQASYRLNSIQLRRQEWLELLESEISLEI